MIEINESLVFNIHDCSNEYEGLLTLQNNYKNGFSYDVIFIGENFEVMETQTIIQNLEKMNKNNMIYVRKIVILKKNKGLNDSDDDLNYVSINPNYTVDIEACIKDLL